MRTARRLLLSSLVVATLCAAASPARAFGIAPVAGLASDPQVATLLLTVGMLGLLLEMQTLHGVAGLIGIGAFALFFATHLSGGFGEGLVLGLALLGVLAILFELHVFPGHGVSGLAGALALGAAVILAFGPALLFVAAQSLSVAIVLSALGFFLSTRVFTESAFVRRLSLKALQGADYVASADQSSLLGRTGVATSDLRPAGIATIDGRRADVLTEGDFVRAGTPVEVTRVEGARVFVRAIAAAPRPALETDTANPREQGIS